MQTFEPLLPGNFYHIYNRGIDGCNLFYEDENYEYFFRSYEKYISPIADTYAWALMKNHFHFLVKIKEDTGHSDFKQDFKSIHQYFSNLFNSYSKSINKKYFRHGGLLERPFKRKLIETQNYLKEALIYINNNPVHHCICKRSEDYKWCSYRVFLSENPPNLYQKIIAEWFNDIENFKFVHKQKVNIEWENSFEQDIPP